MGNLFSCKIPKNVYLENIQNTNNQILDKINDIKNTQNPIELHKDFNEFILNIDDTKINQLIDLILENERLNFTLIPDEIEKQLYRNTIKLIIAAIKPNLNIDYNQDKDKDKDKDIR